MGVCTWMQRECPCKLAVVLTCGVWSRKEYYVHFYQAVLIIQHKYETGDKTDLSPVACKYLYCQFVDMMLKKIQRIVNITLSLSVLFTLMTL